MEVAVIGSPSIIFLNIVSVDVTEAVLKLNLLDAVHGLHPMQIPSIG